MPVTMPGSGAGDRDRRSTVVPLQVLPPPPPVSLEQPIDPDHYVCGAGDVLELNFWGQQNLRLKLTIDLEGRAFIPKVGYVAVADKTLTAMRTAMKQKVRGNYPGLSFDLTVDDAAHVPRPRRREREAPGHVLRACGRSRVERARARRRGAARRRGGGSRCITAVAPIRRRTSSSTSSPATPRSIRTCSTATSSTCRSRSSMVKITGAVRRPGMYEVVGDEGSRRAARARRRTRAERGEGDADPDRAPQRAAAGHVHRRSRRRQRAARRRRQGRRPRHRRPATHRAADRRRRRIAIRSTARRRAAACRSSRATPCGR